MTVEDIKQMERKLLFNPEGTDDLKGRKVIGGETTNLFNLNKYFTSTLFNKREMKDLNLRHSD